MIRSHRAHRRRLRRLVVVGLTALTLLATMLVPGWATGERYEAQVLNGVPAAIADLPSVVFVEFPEHSCTGSLIDAEWVLTGGHCFPGGDLGDVQVYLGMDSFSVGYDALVAGAEVVLHPEYDVANETGVDVALLRLAEPVTTATIALASAGAADPVGSTAIVAGWGVTAPDAGTDVLIRADVPVEADSACVAVYGEEGWPNEDWFVCAGGEQSDACEGDSGGPLMTQVGGQLRLVGVTAFGTSCEVATGTLGGYISVGYVRSWIDATIGGGSDDGDTGNPTAGPGGFFDTVGSPHAEGIAAVAAAGITGGCGGGNYCPNTAVTRGQMATFLMRALDLPTGGTPTFDDAVGTSHAEGIAAVADAGITGGCGGNSYCPNTAVTRGQMATFLMRALDLPAGSSSFEDVAANHPHAAGIAAVAAAGITGGCGGNDYCPNTPVTRGQMATFLLRALDL